MSQSRYRADAPAPQAAQEQKAYIPPHPFDSPKSTRQREIGVVLRQAAHELYLQEGGQEIEHAIALLDAFAVEGVQYAQKILREEREAQAPMPDETKLPEGSEARKLVKEAKRQKPVMDASSAARLCKLLIELVNLRRQIRGRLLQTEEDLLLVVTESEGYETKMEPALILARLRELHKVL
jgi:hypothetical protein